MRAHWELFVPIVLWISENVAHFDPFWLIEAHFCKFWPIELLRGDTQNRDKMRVNLVVFFHFSQSWEFFAELKNSAKVQNRYPWTTHVYLFCSVHFFNVTFIFTIIEILWINCNPIYHIHVFKSRLFYVFHSSLNVIVSIQIKISVFAVALNVFKQRRSYLIFCCQMNDEGWEWMENLKNLKNN